MDMRYPDEIITSFRHQDITPLKPAWVVPGVHLRVENIDGSFGIHFGEDCLGQGVNTHGTPRGKSIRIESFNNPRQKCGHFGVLALSRPLLVPFCAGIPVFDRV